ncbi:ABC transporter ATP-binding protein [bacterium]|nr:ABC transporter ATP-binding protein [bacterium]
MSYLIDVSDVRYSYLADEIQLLRGIDLKILPGEMVSLYGANGSGKTTLAMIIAGIIRPNSGEVLFDGQNIFDEHFYFNPGTVGFLFQDPSEGIIATSVERELAFTPENARIPSVEIKNIIMNVARDFGLESSLKKNIDELSGGNLERCALASTVALKPRLLILDEPDAFLDYEGKRLFWRKIGELRDSETAILYITQSETSARRSDRIVTIEKGVIKQGNLNGKAYIKPITLSNTLNKKCYQFNDIEFKYDSFKAINGIDLKIQSGTRIGLLGASGSGKTTLAKVCAGLFKPNLGSAKVSGAKSAEIELYVSMCFQFPARQLFAETVIEDVEFGPKNLGMDNVRNKAEKALEVVGIQQEVYNKSPFDLSDGQQRWVGIAGVIAMDRDFIIFDEPTASLDNDGRHRFRDIVELLSSKGKTIMIITHDFELAEKCTQRTIILESGGIVWDGETNAFFEDKRLRKSMGIYFDSEV